MLVGTSETVRMLIIRYFSERKIISTEKKGDDKKICQ
jgi:hypothetical protein